MKFIFVLLFFVNSLQAELPTLLPSALQKGDLIALVFPASYLDTTLEDGQAIVNKKVEWLQAQGFRTIFYPKTVHIHGYLAGTDQERADALMEAWKNPEVKAIWCFRGGYGTPRMIDLLDYDWIKTHPKIFIGMSDITALHQAIQIKTGLVTYLAPVLSFFNDPDSSFNTPYAFSELTRVVMDGKIGKIPLPEKMKVISAGKGTGKLIGGNLCLIAALCGTKWQLNTDNKVLVLEDVGADIYWIDRLLWQIQAAGLLNKPAAVILGSWKDCDTKRNNSLTLYEVFHHYFANVTYPVILNFPTGHGTFQTTLPLNTLIEVDTSKLQVELLGNCVSK